jgi:hypothetical protein
METSTAIQPKTADGFAVKVSINFKRLHVFAICRDLMSKSIGAWGGMILCESRVRDRCAQLCRRC